MITPRKIGRLAAAAQFELLLDAVLSNGRPLPVEARLRLSRADSLSAAALALGLQRMIELSGYASAECADVAQELLSHRQGDGSFGSIVSTAASIRALDMFVGLPGADPRVAADAEAALDGATHVIHCAIERDRLSGGEGLPGDELDAALVLWQIGDLHAMRAILALESVEQAVWSRMERGGAAERVLLAAGTGVADRAAA